METKSRSTEWHLVVTLTRGIAMPRVTHRNLTCDIFIFIFQKNIKNKIKNSKTDTSHVVNGVSQLRLKGT